MITNENEKKLLDLATLGGKSVEEAFFEVYKPKNRKSGMTILRQKQKKNPDLFLKIINYKKNREIQISKIKDKNLLKKAKKEIISEIELDAILSGIARGTIIKKKTIPEFNNITNKYTMVTIDEEPSHYERILAADKLYKRKGSYDALRVKHEGSAGADLFLKFLKATGQVQEDEKKE